MLTFTRPELARRIGVTVRMLQWWTENGTFRPRAGRGRYSQEELIRAFLIAQLRRRRFSLAMAARAAKQINATTVIAAISDGSEVYVIATAGGAARIFFTCLAAIQYMERAHAPAVLMQLGNNLRWAMAGREGSYASG